MAAYAARGNMQSLVLIPEGQISWGKLSQSLDYGALTCQLRTDFDGCFVFGRVSYGIYSIRVSASAAAAVRIRPDLGVSVKVSAGRSIVRLGAIQARPEPRIAATELPPATP